VTVAATLSGPIAFDDAVAARAFQAKDEPHVLELLQTAFGQWPRDIDSVTPSEFFHWKHLAGPFGPSIMLVAEADGAVIAFGAYLPWRLRAGGKTLTTMRGVDFAVHPSHRRRGATMAIRAAANFSSDVAFTWSNPNEPSRLSGLKWGQREAGRLPHFAQPRRPLRHTIRRALAKGSRTPERLPIEAESAAEILRDGVHASLLLAPTKAPGDRLATAKDLEYLRWRYGRLEEYRAIRADAGKGGGGIGIFRPRRHGPFWVSHVCELLVEQDDHRTARDLLHQVRDAAPTDFVTCSFPSRRDAALSGFVQYRRKLLMTYPLKPNLAPDPTQRASWALSFGDLDLL
jgi:Acetyltransferase (GNAT) domain